MFVVGDVIGDDGNMTLEWPPPPPPPPWLCAGVSGVRGGEGDWLWPDRRIEGSSLRSRRRRGGINGLESWLDAISGVGEPLGAIPLSNLERDRPRTSSRPDRCFLCLCRHKKAKATMTMNPVTEHTEIAALTPIGSPPLDVVVPLFKPKDSATVGRAGVADSHDGSVMRVASSVVVNVAVDVDKDGVVAALESAGLLKGVALPEVEGMDIGS